MTLTDRVLRRLATGRIVDRADLELGANYDSVGRVLSELVKERKIVRVGRGQYRRASGRKAAATQSIGKRIERKLSRSKRNVFLRGDFAGFGSYDAVGRALRELTRTGGLVQIGYGLYAKSARSPFSGKPVPLVGIRRLAAEALKRLGKSIEPSAFDRAYNSGRSTQVPTGRTLSVKGRVRRRIGYDGNYVVLIRA
jgi:hypothetical protein